MTISLKDNIVLYWPGEEEEAEKYKKQGFVIIPQKLPSLESNGAGA